MSLAPFTAVDNSIDIVGAFLFCTVIFWAVHYVWENHLTVQGRIIYIMITCLSTLQVYQVVMQLLTNDIANFRIWDLINYFTAFLFLMLVHRLAEKEKL